MPSATTKKEETRAQNAARLRKTDIANMGDATIKQLKALGSLEKFGSRTGQGRKATAWISAEAKKRGIK